MIKHLFLIAGLTAGATFSASAQRDNRLHETGVVTVANSDTADVAHVEKSFKSVAPASPNDNGLPRFAIVGKDRQFYIGIGAQVLTEAVYDFGDNVGSPVLFAPSAFTKSAPGNGSGLGFGWQSSSIYANFVAMPGSDNQVGLFFKANFLGNNNSFNVYHLYARYRGLTAGYTTSLFSDVAAEPMTIDFEGPNGYPDLTLFTVYWTQNFSKHWSGALGIDAPATSFTTDGVTSTVNPRSPSIPLYVQYAWSDGSAHVRLSGIIRPMQYRNLLENRNHGVTGCGVQLSGMTAITGPLSAQFNAVYGSGIGSYIQDDEGLGLDAVAVGNDGKMKAVKTMGVTGGLSCTITSKLSANAVYSHVTNWFPDNAAVSSDTYRYGDYAAVNMIYNVNKFVSAGVEYDYGHRKAVDGASLHVNRIQAQLAVTF